MDVERNLTDEELVQRCRQEIPYATKSFEVLLRRNEERVFRFCYGYFRNEHDAEDVSQEIFSRAYFGLPAFRGHSTFRTWLFQIVRNRCAQRYPEIRKSAEIIKSMESASESFLDARTGRRADRRVTSEEANLSAALAALVEEDRTVLLLRHMAELTFEELAQELALNLSAAKMRLYRAEERLKQKYHHLQESSIFLFFLLIAQIVTFSPLKEVSRL